MSRRESSPLQGVVKKTLRPMERETWPEKSDEVRRTRKNDYVTSPFERLAETTRGQWEHKA